MKTQSAAVLLSIMTVSSWVAAEDTVDADDVPRACLDTCRSIIQLSNACDDRTDGDRAYKNCVCTADGQASAMACATCVRQNVPADQLRRLDYDSDSDSDSDSDDGFSDTDSNFSDFDEVFDLMRGCGFPAAAPGAAAPGAPAVASVAPSVAPSVGQTTAVPPAASTIATSVTASQSTATGPTGITRASSSTPAEAGASTPTMTIGAVILGLVLGITALM